MSAFRGCSGGGRRAGAGGIRRPLVRRDRDRFRMIRPPYRIPCRLVQRRLPEIARQRHRKHRTQRRCIRRNCAHERNLGRRGTNQAIGYQAFYARPCGFSAPAAGDVSDETKPNAERPGGRKVNPRLHDPRGEARCTSHIYGIPFRCAKQKARRVGGLSGETRQGDDNPCRAGFLSGAHSLSAGVLLIMRPA